MALSTTKCNTYGDLGIVLDAVFKEGLSGCFPVQRSSWSGIEAPGDLVKLTMAVHAQVGAFCQVLPDQAIDVLIASTLPWAVRVRKVDLQSRAFSQLLVKRHLLALVVRQRLGQSFIQRAERPFKAPEHVQRCRTVNLIHHHKAGSSAHQRADRGLVPGTLDEVSLPVAGHQPVVDLGRPHVDAQHVLQHAPFICDGAATSRPARPPGFAAAARSALCAALLWVWHRWRYRWFRERLARRLVLDGPA